MLTVDVTGAGTFTGTSPAGLTLASAVTDSLVLSTQFTPSAIGTYDFTWSVAADQVDDVPANNDLVGESFDVTQYIYGRDANGTPGVGGGLDGSDAAFEAGNLFDIFADQDVYGVDVMIGAGTPANTLIYGKIFSLDAGGNFVFLEETQEYTVSAGDGMITMVLLSPASVTAGSTYFVSVGCYSEFFYGTSGSSAEQTSFILYGGAGAATGQYFTTQTPMVRMNFDGSIGIDEVSQAGATLGQNMPNPFNNNSTINFELTNTSDVQFEFVDMTGKIVKTMDLGTLTNGAHSVQVDATEFASGVYYYSLVSEGSKITSKMIVQK